MKTAVQDGRKHARPNAGYLEASLTGILKVQLGGEAVYQGEKRWHPHLGKRIEEE